MLFTSSSFMRLLRGVGRCCTSVVSALIVLLLVSPVWAQEASTGTTGTPAKFTNQYLDTQNPSVMGPLDDPYILEIRPSVSTSVGTPFAERLTGVPRPVDEIRVTAIDPSGFPEICTFVDVLDSAGNPIGGMTPDSFCVFQDSVAITSFTVTELKENCPTSICLVIDVSGSMNQDAKIDSAKSAAHQFVDNMDVLDRVAIVKFASCYSLVQGFTSDKALLHSKINTLASGGFTAALDGIWAGVNVTLGETGSKAVIALSDGMENRSQRCDTLSGSPDGLGDGFADDSTLIVDLALGGSIPIYTISLGNTFDPQYLVGLANGSGGSYYHAPTGGDISAIYEEIKFRLCSRYLVCYTSPDTIPSADCHDVIVCHLDPVQGCAPCDTGRYCEPDNPKITLEIDPGCRYPNTDLELCATVTDSDTPAESLLVTLYYRNETGIGYTDVVMSNIGDVFCYTIPGALLTCATDSIQFYVTASDGSVTVANPSSAPINVHAIPVCPPRGPVCEVPNDTVITLCDDGKICLPVGCSVPGGGPLTGPTLLAGPGEIVNGEWCYTPASSGSATMTIACESTCGGRCETDFTVTWRFNSAPVCSLTTTPAPPLCTPPLHVLTFSSTDPDGDPTDCVNTNPNATISDGTWQYVPTPGETVYDTIICTDPCGAECRIPIAVTYREDQPPVCDVPVEDVFFVQCDPVADSVPVTATGGGTCELYNNSPGVLRNDYWVYTPVGDESFEVFVRCFTECDTCTASFLVDFDINAPPVITNCPSDARFSCDQGPGVPPEVFLEDDRPGATLNFTEDSTSGQCAGSYTLTRTWIAVDSCGLADTCVQVVTMFDNVAPEILCGPTGGDGFYECDELVSLGRALATDNCDPDPQVTVFSRDSIPGECASSYTMVVTWEAADACGNTSYCADTITVADTTAPVCSAPNDTSIFLCAPEEICLPFSASDNCAEPLCEIISGPGTLTPNGWCYTPTADGQYAVGIRCTDACDNACESWFTVTVDLNEAPVCDLPNDTSIFLCELAEVQLPVRATDSDGNFAGCFVEGGPGTIVDGYWVYTPTGDESVTVTVACYDSCDVVCRGQFTVDFNINEAPVCEVPNDTTIVVCDDGPYRLPILCADLDDNLIECSVNIGQIVDGFWMYSPQAPETVCVELSSMDDCGEVCVDTFCVTFELPTDPICDVPNDTSVSLCEPGQIRLPVSATDYNGNPATCSIEGPGVLLDGYWVYDAVVSEDLCVVVSCIDSCGSVCVDTFCVAIEVNEAPVCEGPPAENYYFLCDTATICLPFGASDINGNLDYCEVTTPDGVVHRGDEFCFFADRDTTITSILRCYDSCGVVCVDTFTIIVEMNDAPICEVPNDTTITLCAPEEVCLPFSAFDPNGNLEFCGIANDSTGRGGCKNPPCPDNVWCYTPQGDETVEILVRCVDSCGAVCEKTFTVTFEINEAPVCDVPANGPSIPGCLGVPSVMPVSASDADGDSTYCVLVSGPGTLTDGVWSYMPAGGETIDVVIRCYDIPCGDSCEVSFQVTYPDPQPEICNLPGDTAVFLCEPGLIEIPLLASGDCDVTSGPGAVVNGVWTYSAVSDTGFSVEITCIDTCGAVCSDTFNVRVEFNSPPEIADSQDMFRTCENPGSFVTPAIHDVDSNIDSVHFSYDSTAGNCAQEYTLTGTWIVVDSCGAADTTSYAIHVNDNTPPEISWLDVTNIACDDTTALPWPIAVDDCDSDVDIQLVRVDTIPGANGCAYNLKRYFVATDDCGNESRSDHDVHVFDSTAPVLACPPNLTIDCGDDTTDWGWPTVTDNCSDNLSAQLISADTSYVNDLCLATFIVERVWIAVDSCGNQADTCRQVVDVIDTTGPQIICPPDTSISCDELDRVNAELAQNMSTPASDVRIPFPIFGSPTLTDNCNENWTWGIISIDTVQSGCPMTLSVGYQGIDYCGNNSEVCYQTVTVVDALAPVVEVCPEPVYVPCDGKDTLIPAPVFSDNCTVDPVMERVRIDTVMTPGADYCYKYVHSYVARDACDNVSDTCRVEIRVTDDLAPVVTCPQDLAFNCNALDTLNFADSSLGWATVEDNCDLDVVANLVSVLVDSTCPGTQTITRVFAAVDGCGNQSEECSQVIRVVDDTPPVMAIPDYFEPFSCDSVPDIPPPDVMDDCDPNPTLTLIAESSATAADCPQGYQHNFVWEAIDACGNADTATVVIWVTDRTAPVVTCPPDTMVSCDELPGGMDGLMQDARTSGFVFGVPGISDNCDSNPDWRLATVRQVSDTCPYVVEFGFDGVDACGNVSDTCYQTVTITDTVAPVCVLPDDVSSFFCEPGTQICLPIQASDNCGVGNGIDKTARIRRPGQAETRDSVFIIDSTWCYEVAQSEEFWVVVRAADACGNFCLDSFFVSIDVNEPPVGELFNDTTIYLCDTATICFSWYGYDPDSNIVDGAVSWIGSPLRNDGRFGSWSDSVCLFFDTSMVWDFTFYLEDSCGAVYEDSATVTVFVNRPPVCNVLEDQNLFLCDTATICMPVGATDPDDDQVYCSVVNSDGSLTPLDGEWCYFADRDTSFVVTIRCTDDCGAFCESSFNVTVDMNEAPICTPTPDTTIYLCAPGEYCFSYPVGSDADGNLAECGVKSLDDLEGRPSSDQICLFAEHDTTFAMVSYCRDECGVVCADTFYVRFEVDEPPVCETMNDTTIYVCDTATICIPYRSTDADSSLESCSIQLWENNKRFGEMHGEICFFAYKNETYTAVVECADTCGNVCADTVLITVVQYPLPICDLPADSEFFVCEPGTPISLPYGSQALDTCVILRGPGSLTDSTWNHTATVDEEFWVVIECSNLCGSCVDSFMVSVDMNEPPVCDPHADTTIFLCEPTTVCLPISGFDPDGNLIGCFVPGDDGDASSPPPTQWCYNADRDTTVEVITQCIDACGASCTDTFYVTFEMNEAPVCTIPNDTTIYLCDTATMCFPFLVIDPDSNLMDGVAMMQLVDPTQRSEEQSHGTWEGDLCPTFFQSGRWMYTIWATDSCGVECVDTSYIDVIIDRPPLCDDPGDQSFFLCEIDTVRVPFKSTVDSCWIAAGPGILEDGMWKYLPSGEEEFDVTISCANRCGQCDASFHVDIDINTGPTCTIPADTTIYLCDTATLCFPFSAYDPDSNIEFGIAILGLSDPTQRDGSDVWEDSLCWTFIQSERLMYTIYVIDSCGVECADTSYIDVIVNRPPICGVPGDQDLFLCEPDSVIVPMQSVGDTCWVVSGPGVIEDGAWKYFASDDDEFTVVVSCENECGVCIDSFFVSIEMNDPPELIQPPDSIIYLCDTATLCYERAITDPNNNLADWSWVSTALNKRNGDPIGEGFTDTACIFIDVSQTWTFAVYAEDSCGVVRADTTTWEIHFDRPPVCDNPGDQEFFLCELDTVRVPFRTSGDSCWISAGPGYLEEGSWKYWPSGEEEFDVTITCVNGCGECDMTFHVDIDLNSSPVCVVPRDTTLYFCDTATLCYEFGVLDPDHNLASWNSRLVRSEPRDQEVDLQPYDTLCVFVNASDTWWFVAEGTDSCGEACIDSSRIDIIFESAPVCDSPPDADFFLCQPETVMVAIEEVGDSCWVEAGPGILENGFWKYLPAGDESFDVVVACANRCGICPNTFHVTINLNEPPVVEGPPDQTTFLCEVGDTVCIGPWQITDPDVEVCSFRDGQGDGLYCFVPDTAGVYPVIRCAEDSCGAVGCDTTLITVKFNSPPVCVVPNDTTIFLCGPEEVCIPFRGWDPDSNLAFCGSFGPLGRTSCETGRCPENIWCYTPQEPGPVEVFVRCTDSCGVVCETIFTVNFVFNTPPTCEVPNDTTIYLCDTTTWCFPVNATDPDGNLDICGIGMGPFGLVEPVAPGSDYCFEVKTSQAFTFHVVCTDSCGAACEDSVTYNFVLTPPPVCDIPVDQEYFLCEPDTVKVGFKPSGDSCWVSSGKGFVEDGWWKYLPSGDESFTVELSCANECGVCSGSFNVLIDINEGPVCDPHNDTTIFLCEPQIVCLPVTGADPDGNLLRCYSPKSDCRGCEVPDGEWCYYADGDTTVAVITICVDECNDVCVDTFWVTFEMNEAPTCQAPNDTTIFQCEPTEVAIPIAAIDADGNFDSCHVVASSPGIMQGGFWIYAPVGEEVDTVRFECIDSCGAVCSGQFIVTFDMNQPPICETQPPAPPRCMSQRMIVPILTEDPEGQPTECALVEGPGDLIDGVWQWDPIPGTRDTVVIHCADTCGAICEVWFEINIPELAPPICVLPENQDLFFCGPTEIRLPVSGFNNRDEDVTCEIVGSPGELINGEWVFQATQTDSFDVTIRCSDICGDFCEGTFTIKVTMNADPVCELPGDQTYFQCTPEQIVLPYGVTDADNNMTDCQLISGPGVLEKGNWVFTPVSSGTWVVTIRCYDECDAYCEGSFTVTVDIDEPPVCNLPNDTTIEQCVPEQVMLPVSATFFDPGGQGRSDGGSRGSRSMRAYTQGTVFTRKGERADYDRQDSGMNMAAGDIIAGCSIVSGPGTLIDGYWVYTPTADETAIVEVLCIDQCGFECRGTFTVTFAINDAPICEFRTPSPQECAPPILVVPFSATDPELGPVTTQLLAGPGTVVDQVWSYSPIPGESFDVLIRNSDNCGLSCDIAFHIDVPTPQPPVCVIPTVDQNYFLCQAGQVTAPVSATGGVGEVTCVVVGGPGSIVAGQWVYNASAPGEFDVTVECSDNCGTTCQGTFHVTIEFNSAPTCNLPGNLVLDRCEASEIVLPVSADDIDGNLVGCEIISGPGTLVNGDWTWTPTGSGTNWVTIRCIDECGAICEGSFSVTVGDNSAPICGVDDQYIAGCDQGSASVPLNTIDPDGNLKRCRVISGPGTIQNGNWEFTSVISGVYNVTIECTDSCGATCTDDFSVVFDLNDPPVCTMRDTTIILCGVTDVVLPLDIIDPDGNLSSIAILSGPGSIIGNSWYYHLLEDLPVDLVIQAIDDCGMTCISSFRVNFQFGDLRLCDFPWQDTVFLCGPGPFCFDVPPGCNLTLGMAKVQGSDMCFEATQEGTYWATVACTDDCGNVCNDSVSFAVVFTDLPDCGPTITSSNEGDSGTPATASGPCDCPRRGDMNGDGVVSTDDLALIVSLLLDEPVTLTERAGCPTANVADVNCDGTLDIRDVEALKTYMFSRGGAPCSRCASIAAPSAPRR